MLCPYFAADLTGPWRVSLPVVVSCLGINPSVTGAWACAGNPEAEDCSSLLGTSSWLGGGAGKEAALCRVSLTGPWLVRLPVVVSCLGIKPVVTDA